MQSNYRNLEELRVETLICNGGKTKEIKQKINKHVNVYEE